MMARMGLGGWRRSRWLDIAVGGKKSRHTTLGTAVGAATGESLGRATC